MRAAPAEFNAIAANKAAPPAANMIVRIIVSKARRKGPQKYCIRERANATPQIAELRNKLPPAPRAVRQKDNCHPASIS
jgi:hypothetical protein